MTLIIAAILIYGFKLPTWMFAAAAFVWVCEQVLNGAMFGDRWRALGAAIDVLGRKIDAVDHELFLFRLRR